jgi:DNA-binding SARP family transcriptional activator
VENTAGTRNWGTSEDPNDGGQWQDTIDLLRLVQSDYAGARRELDRVSQTLAERETLVNQRLQYAMLTSGGYRTLCLMPYAIGVTGNLMGRAILGSMTYSVTPPNTLRLEARCLGRFELSSEGRRIERWKSVKSKSVFQYLMTRPREPVVKDVLMETLWPDCDLQAASNNLKAAVHGLRQTLSRLLDKKETIPYILFLQGSYLMSPEVELWVDVEQFERHWAVGRRFEKEGKPDEARREFELAESLYRGDYLEDEPYEEWTLLRREALKDTYVIILGKLADYSIEMADYEGCIVYCQKILAKDPCREDAYRRLMLCHSRLGQRNRALRWYEICRRTVQAELTTSPDRETETLYHKLLNNGQI